MENEAYEEVAVRTGREILYGSAGNGMWFMERTAAGLASFWRMGKSAAVTKVDKTVHIGGWRQL